MTRKEFERITPEQAGICSEDIEWLLDQLESGIRTPWLNDYEAWKNLCGRLVEPLCSQSHSKTYAATAIGIAYTEGLLKLDERLIEKSPGRSTGEPLRSEASDNPRCPFAG